MPPDDAILRCPPAKKSNRSFKEDIFWGYCSDSVVSMKAFISFESTLENCHFILMFLHLRTYFCHGKNLSISLKSECTWVCSNFSRLCLHSPYVLEFANLISIRILWKFNWLDEIKLVVSDDDDDDNDDDDVCPSGGWAVTSWSRAQ